MNRNDPLKCCIEDGVLIMQIGVQTLAHAVKLNPELAEYDQEANEWKEPEIIDADVFAKEVLTELVAESEDGTTLVHIAIDTAASNAIENGAEGVRLPEDK